MENDVSEVNGTSLSIAHIVNDCKDIRSSIASLYSRIIDATDNLAGIKGEDWKHLKRAEIFCFKLLREIRDDCNL